MPNRLYDWKALFKKRRFTLEQGTDYTCSQASMTQQIRTAASDRGLSVSVVEGPGSLTVVVTKRENHATAS